MLLAGKTVIVSGVGAGLGHRVAETVVRDGGRAVLGARTAANLAKSAAEIDPEGSRTAHLPTDITDEECRQSYTLFYDATFLVKLQQWKIDWIGGHE